MFASIAAIEIITSLGALVTQNTVYAASVSWVNGFVLYVTTCLCFYPGSMFASIAAIEVITSLGALVTQNTVYAATVSWVNGFVFYVMAGYIFIDFILFM